MNLNKMQVRGESYGTVLIGDKNLILTANTNTDWFHHPADSFRRNDVLSLATEVAEGTFSVRARVSVDFASPYDAGAVFVQADDDNWAKLEIDRIATALLEEGRRFARNVTQGLANAGVDTRDAFEMLLAMRRLGARYLEREWGVGTRSSRGDREPVIAATILTEIHEMAEAALRSVTQMDREALKATKQVVLVATSDVHEHGKMLIDEMLKQLNVDSLDGGVSTDPEKVAELVQKTGATAVAISTYNGVA